MLNYICSSVRSTLFERILSIIDAINYFSIVDVDQVESILHSFPMIIPIYRSDLFLMIIPIYRRDLILKLTSFTLICQQSSTRMSPIQSKSPCFVRVLRTFSRIFKPYLMFNGDPVALTISSILTMLNSAQNLFRVPVSFFFISPI